MNDGSRKVRARRAAAATVCLLAAGLAPASAIAARPQAKRSTPKLTVTSISASATSLKGRQRFTIRGKVANRGGAASPAQLELTLRGNVNPVKVFSLGGVRLATVKAHSSRSFSASVTAPVLKRAVPGGFRARVCVRTHRGAPRVICERAGRRVFIEGPKPKPVPPKPPAPPAPPAPPVDPTVYTSGARTLNDSLFPTIGNGGYDAEHYDLDISYPNPITRVMLGTATITAIATQNLKDFSFDFQSKAVNEVTVDGRPATFAFDYVDSKLIVTPSSGIRTGTTFTVKVVYGGPTSPVIDPDGSSEGWIASATVGATALGEPIGAQGWFPNNNVPTDKATYDISVTPPAGFQAVSNGVLDATIAHDDGTSTYEWSSAEPMASYLATISIARFDTTGSDFSNPDRPLYVYVDGGFTTNRARMIADQQRVPSILDYYAGYYGVPYPFGAAGGIVPRLSVGYALETQTKPTYATASTATGRAPGITTVAHENAHQWFGDFVTLAQWKDIWLNEGITEFSSWLWDVYANGSRDTMADRFSEIYDDPFDGPDTTFWSIAPANPPTAADIFDTDAMYDRGATTMTAIREIFLATPSLGEDGFRAMMRKWLTSHAYGNVTTEEFVALVKATDPTRATRWDEFLTQWLYTPYEGDPSVPGNKPSITPANFDTP
ncbi:M1 family metallopeptidase [Conexibacter sp. CPCC 206217]|uniref:M1 family metallopeptidase n=1 Tax=Conexibacter sp. CPCC 206217 TaxID=3064574 RepID=UPI00271EF6FA|nr:M1 family metallopeptidase [Conexibacter sp. CPCC 206217]MDO8209957.1 M1 family metallopeptidase [Conexibacter sp. CPCC 206217]